MATSRSSRRDVGRCLAAGPPTIAAPTWRAPTGPRGRGLAAFDAAMRDLMRARDVPAGALAVVRHGLLVLARGYTYGAGPDAPSTRETTPFRVAGLARPLAAAAVAGLVQHGRLGAHDDVADHVGPDALAGAGPGPGDGHGHGRVTVERLAQHPGGGERGTRLLEDVVAAAAGAGSGYVDHVRRTVLGPLGITRMRPAGSPAGGGWLASVVDYARFATIVGGGPNPVLDEWMVDYMLGRPDGHEGGPPWHGYGWWVHRFEDGARSAWHAGGPPGARTLVTHRPDGVSWVLLLDHGPGGPAAPGVSRSSDDDRALAGPLHAVAGSPSTAWPDVDFFPEYFPT